MAMSCPVCKHEKYKLKERNWGAKKERRVQCLNCGAKRGISAWEAASKPSDEVKLTTPVIPSSLDPIADIISRNCERVERKLDSEKIRRWMPFALDTDKPVAIVFVGDPHLDDDNCYWPGLVNDVEIMANHPRIFGVNLGDLLNNWVGRLVDKYAEQHTTRSEGWRLAEWFIRDAGIDWLVHILGNHDTWNDGLEILQRSGGKRYIAEDWRARFRLCFSNGCEVKIDAAHDHKGHSQYNPVHGQQKAAKFEEPAHIIIGGHKHNWHLAQDENPHTNMVSWYARARGYKLSFSGYDKRGQWGSQTAGMSIIAVINPRAKSEAELIQCFPTVSAGRDYLDKLLSNME